VKSVKAQVYPHWELVCVNDGSPERQVRTILDKAQEADPRLTVIHCPTSRGSSSATNLALRAATGNYVCFLGPDGYLEPHALYQFARVILQDQPDVLYSDEAITGQNIHNVLEVHPRCQFSHDAYLSHPSSLHLLGVRTELVRQVGGMRETMLAAQDIDLLLRLLEVSETVSYVPDVLYRRRARESLDLTQQERVSVATRQAIEEHLERIGSDAEVHNESLPPGYFDVRFRHRSRAQVAILIPTRNQPRLLRECVTSLERTVPKELAEIVVIDHQSDEPEARHLIQKLGQRHQVLPYRGTFNFSAIMNHAAACVRGRFTHYLFLNDDTCAIGKGWLEHMLGFGQRPEVGIVGATLLFADDRIQHSGVVVGMQGCAGHVHRMQPLTRPDGLRHPGPNGSLLRNRDCSAVTGACLLVRADLFDELSGFEEELPVGFNDIDLCLRARQLGYKVIQDAHAILYHYESQTRAVTHLLEHPRDSQRFCERYSQMVFEGDPYHSPLLSRVVPDCSLGESVRAPWNIRAWTTRILLPNPVESGLLDEGRALLKRSA
jgi:GT2 family glycosyltransferase